MLLSFVCSKYHEKQGQHKIKLRRAKQTYVYETGWRDQRIKVLERELAFTLDASVRVKLQPSYPTQLTPS